MCIAINCIVLTRYNLSFLLLFFILIVLKTVPSSPQAVTSPPLDSEEQGPLDYRLVDVIRFTYPLVIISAKTQWDKTS